MDELSEERALETLEERICALLEAGQIDELRVLLTDTDPPDLADVLERLDDDDKVKVFELLSLEQGADVLHELGTETVREVFEALPMPLVADILQEMPMDDVAEILSVDVPELQEDLLQAMDRDDASEVRDLLQYRPKTAGRLMTDKFVHISAGMSVEQVIALLHSVDPEVETVSDLYVLDAYRRVIGVVSLRQVITSPPAARIADIMETDVVTVSPDVDQEEVARLVARYDFLAMPVVSADQRMLGIVTVDDIIHVLVEEGTEDVLRFGAVEGGTINQPYFTVPLARVIRTRIGWLLLLFLAETLTGVVLRTFEDELAQVVALSFFIPLLIGTGGNTGAQTVSTIIRGLALREIRLGDAWRVILRELGSGLLLGIILGAVGLLRALLWGSSFHLALTVGLTVVLICTWANTIASLIPLLAYRFKIDPAVVSAPLITTLVDATGLAIYMLIAKLILGL